MDFNLPIQLLGFYNKINQHMHPEQIHVKDAETLAQLLSKSFAGLQSNVNSSFSAALRGDAVFIFRNNKGDLYAYHPCQGIARITDVRYDSKHILKVKRAYKKWFIPGEPFIINKKAPNGVLFDTLSDKSYMVDIYPNSIYRNRDDYYIKLGTSSYAIYFDDVIGLDDLKTLILHKWICLSETKMSEYCGDCDGWDYSGCDMDRCREDCNGCGGRKYKCNNSCFNYRHKIAITLCLRALTIKKELYEAIKILDEICKPHSMNADDLWETYQPLFASLEDNCKYIQQYFARNDDMQNFLNKLDEAFELQNARHSKSQLIEIKEYELRKTTSFKIPVSDVNIEQYTTGLLWSKKIHTKISFNTYDHLSDTYIDKEYSLCKEQKYSYLLDKQLILKSTCIILEQKNDGLFECKVEVK